MLKCIVSKRNEKYLKFIEERCKIKYKIDLVNQIELNQYLIDDEDIKEIEILIIDKSVVTNYAEELENIFYELKNLYNINIILLRQDWNISVATEIEKNYIVINFANEINGIAELEKLLVDTLEPIQVKKKIRKVKQVRVKKEKESKKIKSIKIHKSKIPKVKVPKVKREKVKTKRRKEIKYVIILLFVVMIAITVPIIYIKTEKFEQKKEQVYITVTNQQMINAHSEDILALISTDVMVGSTEVTTVATTEVTTQTSSSVATTQAPSSGKTTVATTQTPSTVATMQTTTASTTQATTQAPATVAVTPTISLSGYNGQIYTGSNVKSIAAKFAGQGVSISVLKRDNSTTGVDGVDNACSYLCQAGESSLLFIEQ